MENLEGQFNFNNEASRVEAIERHRQNKEARERKEEINCLRREISKLKENTLKHKGADFKSLVEGGSELNDVDVEELKESDLGLYEQLKSFMKGKIAFDDLVGQMSKHRIDILKDLEGEEKEKGKEMTFDEVRSNSRYAFLAWLTNKLIGENAKKVYLKRERGKKAVAGQ